MCDKLCELWALIEHKAFSPQLEVRKRWLIEFHKFLPFIWGNEPRFDRPKDRNNSFLSDDYPISFDILCCKPIQDAKVGFFYSIRQDLNKFDIQIYWLDESTKKYSSIQFGYDSSKLCEYKLYNRIGEEELNEINNIENIKEVFNKRIVHPALHYHLQDSKDSLHEIRLGLACINPFVTLYQIALQVCLSIDEQYGVKKMNEEIEIISNIILKNLDSNHPSISPGILFKR